jgi:pilus assembly protein CpaB
MSAEDLIAREALKLEDVPRQFVAANAISSVRAIEGQVLATPLSAGEQVTTARFQFPSQAGLAYTVPEGMVAVSISNDAVKGVAGLVKPGDYVMAVASFDAPTGDEQSAGRDESNQITRVLLPKLRVLAVGGNIGTESAPTEEERGASPTLGSGRQQDPDTGPPSTLTVAVSPANLEKLVFAENNGEVHLALMSAADEAVPPTKGRTFQTIFE